MIITVALASSFMFLLSYAIVWLVFRYSEKHAVLDHPNERSSHVEPTATGGGLAVAVCLAIGMLLLWQFGILETVFFYAVLPPVAVIAITGWLDVHNHVRTIYRVFIYSVSALWAVMFIGGFPELNLGGVSVQTGIIGVLLAVLGIIWLTNLYNFMDGIDGFAAIQAICVSMGGTLLLLASELPGEAVLCFFLVSATLGYLVWNWPPAKIFMGDVGSCPLGFYFGVMALWSHSAGGPQVYVWLILLSVFIADATYTLIMRVMQRHEWYAAHRSHAYQKLVQIGYTHKQLSIGLLILNLFLIWPLAYLAYLKIDQALYITVTVYTLLGGAWWLIQHRPAIENS
ncbi:MAG: glycosyltransferase family 4 protein [Thiotrichales bacterium]|nr:glycosyltransferase family 4 protein [Thiotrichales bacterium]